jgi:hypothetical protein
VILILDFGNDVVDDFSMMVLEIGDFLEVMKAIDVFWMVEMEIDDFWWVVV